MQHNTTHTRRGADTPVCLGRRTAAPVASAKPLARRGGAVIIVVLALLSLLMFLGVFFFEFVQEEKQAANAFAANPYDELVNPDKFLDEADSQLIVGPDTNRPMSPLYAGDSAPGAVTTGSVHSMLAILLGRIS